MNINSAFPSDYLRACDLEEQERVFTVRGVEMREIGMERNQRPVVFFKECTQGLVLNKTNANTIATLYGPETKGWKDKKITLFPTEVAFQGQQTEAIRVKSKRPKETEQSEIEDDIPF